MERGGCRERQHGGTNGGGCGGGHPRSGYAGERAHGNARGQVAGFRVLVERGRHVPLRHVPSRHEQRRAAPAPLWPIAADVADVPHGIRRRDAERGGRSGRGCGCAAPRAARWRHGHGDAPGIWCTDAAASGPGWTAARRGWHSAGFPGLPSRCQLYGSAEHAPQRQGGRWDGSTAPQAGAATGWFQHSGCPAVHASRPGQATGGVPVVVHAGKFIADPGVPDTHRGGGWSGERRHGHGRCRRERSKLEEVLGDGRQEAEQRGFQRSERVGSKLLRRAVAGRGRRRPARRAAADRRGSWVLGDEHTGIWRGWGWRRERGFRRVSEPERPEVVEPYHDGTRGIQPPAAGGWVARAHERRPAERRHRRQSQRVPAAAATERRRRRRHEHVSPGFAAAADGFLPSRRREPAVCDAAAGVRAAAAAAAAGP